MFYLESVYKQKTLAHWVLLSQQSCVAVSLELSIAVPCIAVHVEF